MKVKKNQNSGISRKKISKKLRITKSNSKENQTQNREEESNLNNSKEKN